MRFALMWANHDWVDIHPAKLSGLGQHARLLYPGAVTRETLDTIADVVVERYFRHPTYWLVDGCPYFSVYDLAKLMEGLGGLEATRDALASFRAKVRAAGFPDLHLNAVVWSVRILPGETAIASPNELLSALGFDSITSYVWIHHVPLQGREAVSSLQVEYESVRDQYMAYWEETEKRFSLPYFPNVTMGWDSSPRTVQSDVYVPAGYPFTPILAGNTPERFQAALAEAKARLERLPAASRV